MVELELNTENICFIISKAKVFHAKEDVVIPEKFNSPGDDWALQVLADHMDDLTFVELKRAILDLDKDQQITLVTLMWIGRGDYSVDEWEDAYHIASEQWTARTTEYLMAHPYVADYLTEGLAQFGYSCDA